MRGLRLKGVLPKSGELENNSTQGWRDLVRLFPHDGRTEERAGIIQLRG